MDPYTLLVIARTQSLAKRLRSALNGERYSIRWAPSTSHALKLDIHPSLLLLDLPLSGGGRSVARLRNRFDAPVVALQRTTEPIPDGVDAFLLSPYHEQWLAELIETTLIDHRPHMIRAAGMSLDTEARRLQLSGTIYQLRPIGCQILATLMARAGSVVSRDELLQQVWQTDDGGDTRALDVHIAHLRQTLETDPRNPTLILTERGVGYRLQPPA
jgi:two-component system KDP operon response regulator KdpE